MSESESGTGSGLTPASGSGTGPGIDLKSTASGLSKHEKYGCLYCKTAASFKGEINRMPKTCPTLTHEALVTERSAYLEEPLQTMMQVADQTPFNQDRFLRNRVEELIVFAKGLGYQRLGIAFCVTLMQEAQALARMMEAEGLEAVPVCCRVGALDYSEINLPKTHPDKFAAICNPIAQAKLLNLAQVQLVVQVGLCIGHDLILQQESRAPVTTLVVKDRVYDHDPVEALRSKL